MKPVFYGILIGALGIILVVASKSKSDPLPPGTVFDKIVDVRTAAEFQEDQAAGLAGWCPPYAMLGINTCNIGKKSD